MQGREVGDGVGGWERSAKAWIRFIDDGDRNRIELLDPAMEPHLRLLSGMRVLDLGCGEGRLCRTLAHMGAHPVGIDPVLRFVEEAARRLPTFPFLRADAERLPLQDESFDAVVSCVSLVDIPNHRRALQESVRVLRKSGTMLIANLNPFMTCGSYIMDEPGVRTAWAFEDYVTERAEWAEWRGLRIQQHHRPLASLLSPMLEAGMRLISYEEPMPRNRREGSDRTLLPFFHLMSWRKE